MRINGSRFREFHERVKDQFPYNDLKTTRTSYRAKWLLMSCKTDPGILFYHVKFYPLLCSTLDVKCVQELIITKKGIPLPADFCSVLDCMFHWGRSLSWSWYNKSLELMNYYLTMSDLNRAEFKETDLYLDVIQMRVLQLINHHFEHGNSSMSEDWLQYYRGLVNSGERDFFSLAVASFRYTNVLINAHLRVVDFENSTYTELDDVNDIKTPMRVES